MRKSLLALGLMAATSAPVMAADYSDGDIHKNDYKWMQFNLMGAFNEKGAGPESSHDYLEMEFGGRSGVFDLYGYVDVFNLLSNPSSDKDGAEKIFMKFAPRISLDAATGKDLSFGAVQEVYISTLMEWGGNSGVNSQKIGLGSDIMVPWLGKIGLNLYGTYDSNQKDWNGFQISTNWFKPFHFFENGSFISYQGYIDYQFGMKDDNAYQSKDGGAMFNGIYWHSDRFAVGYGLKLYHNVYGFEDGATLPWAPVADSSGVGHYLSLTYKF
ncbi:outer membrane protein OmpK [Vibrio aestuarianus]|uniref:Outer membrane protein OmpK n=1 Tax=Vibrio aestuarianus TaxID=28171 RepID=A0AAX3U2R2_9VIBR|nr:outer membrane protein OmpK [Vibrio aestuarianus]MDE1230392.1 outer membrane protein OmpK [Vibrio aestuarianus]MDE1239554.1 outer membrane protein OmpK [Vibrio aestuarianus]WGK80855.1 outer membrane protein OmpK [Vibrio aestuarianus]